MEKQANSGEGLNSAPWAAGRICPTRYRHVAHGRDDCKQVSQAFTDVNGLSLKYDGQCNRAASDSRYKSNRNEVVRLPETVAHTPT